jgi:hypothetical protein
MPLFAPSEVLELSHSWRVPSGTSTFGLDDEHAFAAALRRAVAEVPTQAEALGVIAESSREASAYALLLLGESEQAEVRLTEPFFPDDDRAFVDEARTRRSQVLKLLRSEGPDAASGVLRCWRDETAQNLGVT